MRKIAVAVTTVLLTGLFAASVRAQDFQKTYPLPAGGQISISNVSGNIAVTGYNGTAVTVSGIRSGRDRNEVEIVDESTAGTVIVKVRYPSGGNYDADVNFTVQVPRGSQYRFDSLATASGDISVTDVAGDLTAKTASGDVTMQQVQGTVKASTASGDIRVAGAAGGVNARTASGNVDVELTSIEGDGPLAFSSASGDITVKVPARISADVALSTASGRAESDFPLTVDDRQTHGRRLYGRIGSGALQLKMSTASGNVRLGRL
jgi:DUF4097 and DUF4098 domain-containing protein YvlB